MKLHEKRIRNEVRKFSLGIPVNVEELENGLRHVTVTLGNLEFEITESYPFHPPIVKVLPWKVPYQQFLRIMAKFTSTRSCPLCTSIICTDYWSAGSGVKDVLCEYNMHLDSLKVQRIIKLGNLVLARNSAGDIDLSEYLTLLPPIGAANRWYERTLN